MKTTEENRGELFEAWWDSLASHWSDKSARTAAWQAFNAALDAIEIKLPSVYDFHSTSGMKRGCKESIESLNLGIKIK